MLANCRPASSDQGQDVVVTLRMDQGVGPFAPDHDVARRAGHCRFEAGGERLALSIQPAQPAEQPVARQPGGVGRDPCLDVGHGVRQPALGEFGGEQAEDDAVVPRRQRKRLSNESAAGSPASSRARARL